MNVNVNLNVNLNAFATKKSWGQNDQAQELLLDAASMFDGDDEPNDDSKNENKFSFYILV